MPVSSTLCVPVPPSIDEDAASPDDNVIINDNSLYLDCPITGIPRPSVVW